MMYEKKSIVKRKVRYRAQKDGSKYYYTGEVCKNGHIAWRETSSGKCVECSKLYHIKTKSKRGK